MSKKLLFFIFLCAVQQPVRGCATVTISTELIYSLIHNEQAVIIWDEAHKIEHFIRQADISTTEPNLGFLVPTPQTPELVEADPRIFELAADVARPEMVPNVEYHTPLGIVAPIIGGPAAGFALGNAVKGVSATISDQLAYAGTQIIREQDVGDYHAAILGADNAKGLGCCLKNNGYAWSDDDADLAKLVEDFALMLPSGSLITVVNPTQVLRFASMLIVVVSVTTIMSQRTAELFAKLASPVTFIVRQCGVRRHAISSLDDLSFADILGPIRYAGFSRPGLVCVILRDSSFEKPCFKKRQICPPYGSRVDFFGHSCSSRGRRVILQHIFLLN